MKNVDKHCGYNIGWIKLKYFTPLFHTKIETVAQLSLEVVLVCCTPGFVSVLIDDILKTMKSECAMEIRFLGKHTPWQGIIRSKSQSATVCASRFMALEQYTMSGSQGGRIGEMGNALLVHTEPPHHPLVSRGVRVNVTNERNAT